MRFGWSQHQQLAALLERTNPADQGMALALMGAALLMLVQDLERRDDVITVLID